MSTKGNIVRNVFAAFFLFILIKQSKTNKQQQKKTISKKNKMEMLTKRTFGTGSSTINTTNGANDDETNSASVNKEKQLFTYKG